ncbi:carbohydrate ABC transporter membrane protein 1 (CUT1 family) [Arthrobacter sp. SLBN-100]|uniref:carbohydrate ABC transporter permease n=1 Tax=Arthrobacter sp. SLBN-100 TaxID=2768450 RepID=UPI001152CA3B|nr:sugar ABC transporter permease [Arthrobacter sp. SLBN-100]TQJ68430.1 carbohydrate ABC transporter membrane protein 1 (CUT1 family) [Arthrobacter sp. SLBN-100]
MRSTAALPNAGLQVEGSRRAGGQTPTVPHGRKPMTWKKRSLPWAYMAPSMIVLLLMTVAPAAFIFYSAFRNDKILGGVGRFVGFNNFIEAVSNASVRHAFLITLAFVAGAVILEMLLGFALALPLAAQTTANKVGAALMLLPFAVTPAVAAMVFKQLLNPNYGWVGYYLGQLGFPKGVDLLGDPTSAWIVLLILDMWQWTPFIALILMAGLQSLPGEPREAALVDGASPWQMFRHITLPGMIPFIAIAAVLRTIQAFKTFDSFKILTGGGPGSSTEIINLGIFRVGLQSFNVGLACALGVIFLIILSLLVPLMLRVIGRRSDPEEI